METKNFIEAIKDGLIRYDYRYDNSITQFIAHIKILESLRKRYDEIANLEMFLKIDLKGDSTFHSPLGFFQIIISPEDDNRVWIYLGEFEEFKNCDLMKTPSIRKNIKFGFNEIGWLSLEIDLIKKITLIPLKPI